MTKDSINKDIVKYDAFISYRHSELDSFVAQTLHKQLENFKLPKNVARRKMVQARSGDYANAAADERQACSHVPETDDTVSVTETVKTRISRVFRDKEELPLVTNLADPITEALQNSEYLIVICSPRLPESMWCRKEIETFIEMHDREHVLAVLIEGEPDTSFPEELLYREVEETGTDGTVIKRKIPVEPLAADVRGADYKEIRRKIKSELLRLAAPMFDCNYDDLRQRHRERRMRRIIMTSVSVSAICLSFGLISTAMALRIKHQNTQIKEQNTQIKAQSDEIAGQAAQIEQQYEEAKRNHAISRSKEAIGYLESGDRMRAVATAQDALLDLSGTGGIEADVDYPAQAVYALTDSLYLYENGQQILPDRTLEADTAVRVMKLSPQGSRILTIDASGQATVWNPADEKEQIRITDATFHISSGENEAAFLGEDGVFCPVEDEIVLYDVSDGSAAPTYRVRCEDYVGMVVSQEQKQAIMISENGYQAVDCAHGTLLYVGAWDMDGLTARASAECVISEDGRYWAVGLVTPYGEENERQAVAVYDMRTGERIAVYPIDYEYIRSMRFDGDRLYVVSCHSGEMDFTQVTMGMESRLQAYDIHGTDSPVWTYERSDGWLYDTACSDAEDSNYLLCSGYSDVVALDKRDGSYIDLFGFGVEVIKLGSYSGSDAFMAFTRDGVWHYLDMNRREDMVGTLFPACTSTNVMDFAIGDGYCVTLPYGSRRMTLYRTASGAGMEKFHQGEYRYKEAVVSGGGAYMAAACYNDGYTTAVEMFRTDGGEQLWDYTDDSSYIGMLFFDYHGRESLALITDEQVMILNPENGEVLSSDTLEIGGSYDYLGCSSAGDGMDQEWHRYVYLWGDRTLCAYDLTDMKPAYEISHKENAGYDDAAAVWSRAGGSDSGQKDCYVITDKEAGALRFYCMGEEIYTYGGEENATQHDAINYKYIETLFFDENEQGVHLNIVYMDGRITGLTIDLDPAGFCTAEGEDGISERYNGLEEVMRRYEQTGDICIMRGNGDAYLLTKSEGDILARMHGFLCCDSTNGQIYLENNRTIYRLPLYTLEEIIGIASKMCQTGQ